MLPKQSEIEMPFLTCLDQLGGKAKPSEVCNALLNFFPQITQADLAETLPSGANKWKNSVAWVRQKLISLGQIESPARGEWLLTDRGRKRLESPGDASPLRRRRSRSTPSVTTADFEALFPRDSRVVRSELRLRLKATGEEESDFENSVWVVIHSLMPSDITVGRDPEIVLPSEKFHPDVAAVFDGSRVLVVECKFTEHDAFIAQWVLRFPKLKRELEDLLRKKGRNQFVYVLAVKDKATLKSHITDKLKALRVHLIDKREIDYFQKLLRVCGIGVAHLFWARVAPWVIRHEEHRLPALRVKQGRNHVYIFSANAHDLLSRSFVSHRELHDPGKEIGFQRMLQRKKLKEIEGYIERYRTFPTPIVVAFRKPGTPIFEPLPLHQRAAESMRKDVEFGFLKLPADASTIQIIDGQHRLYGYSKLPSSTDHVIQVVGYKANKDFSPPTLFVDINSKQTSVPSRLLWELYPDIYGEEDPDFYKAQISSAVEDVAKERLSGFVQHISSGMKGEISFHTLCSEVRRARLLGMGGPLHNEAQLRLVLDALFIALTQLGERYRSVNSGFIYSNNGIAPTIRTAARIIRYEAAHGRADNLKRKNLLVDTFRSFFKPVYEYYSNRDERELRTLRKQRIGNAGSNTTEDEMTDKIRAGYRHDFPYRPKKSPPEWERVVERFASLVSTINREVSERGLASGWVFREFDAEKFKKQLGKPIENDESFGVVLEVLYKEVIEGTGKDGVDNRLKQLLCIPKIYDIGAVDQLNALRNYREHKTEQVDQKKRQFAIKAMAELLSRPSLGGPSELDPADYQNLAIALTQKLTEQILDPVLAVIQKR